MGGVRLQAQQHPAESVCCMKTDCTDSHHTVCVTTVKPMVPKCHVPKSVPFGKSAELSCVEEEGFPKSQYQWFKNKEEIPDDPKTSLKFFNSSYTLNADTGTLVSMQAHVFGQGHTRVAGAGRGGGNSGPTPRGGGRYFGEMVGGPGLEPQKESAALVCTFLKRSLLPNMTKRFPVSMKV